MVQPDLSLLLLCDSGVSMAVKMPSSTLKKECAAILESMKVSFLDFSRHDNNLCCLILRWMFLPDWFHVTRASQFFFLSAESLL